MLRVCCLVSNFISLVTIHSLGCLLIYLPPYSPDMNPIEESFSTCMRISFSKPWINTSYIPSKSLSTLTWPSNSRGREPRDGSYGGLWVCNSRKGMGMVSPRRVYLEWPLIDDSFYYTQNTRLYTTWELSEQCKVRELQKAWQIRKTEISYNI